MHFLGRNQRSVKWASRNVPAQSFYHRPRPVGTTQEPDFPYPNTIPHISCFIVENRFKTGFHPAYERAEHFEERLRRERIAQNHRQADLAALAGISQDALSSIENGRPVTTHTLVRVPTALEFGHVFAEMLPKAVPSPIELQKLKGKQRQRVR